MTWKEWGEKYNEDILSYVFKPSDPYASKKVGIKL